MKLIKWILIVLLLNGCQKEKTSTMTKFECEYRNVVTFSGVGDNLIHSSIFRDAYNGENYDFSKMYENVVEDIQKSDIAFINQETVLGGNELGLSGYPMFNSPSEIAQDLYEAGFNLVNLATNHSLDRYEKGIENELNELEKYDFIYDGVYTSQEEYDQIKTFEIDGITFSFLAYTYGTNEIEAPYSYNVSYFDEQQIRKDIQKAKEISDFIIVSAHWGNEDTFIPNSMQIRYAQLFADLEVDVVIGTHPHVLQPIEWVKGKNGNDTLVAYSLGNFLGGMVGLQNAVSGMLQFDVVEKEDGITIENVHFVPLFIHFEQYGDNWVDDRNNYKIYKISEYTNELASLHALNNYNNQDVNLSAIYKIVNDIIDESFLEESWNG